MSLSTSSTAAKSDLPQLLDTLGLAGICLTLIVAFYYQLYLAELPCPLCLLQRVGLVVVSHRWPARFGIQTFTANTPNPTRR